MKKFIFILGNNQQLSVAEIKALLPKIVILNQSAGCLVVGSSDFDCQQILSRLGGTIKIGRWLGEDFSMESAIDYLIAQKSGGRLNFGFSYYGLKPDRKVGLEIKKILKVKGRNSRVVVSRDDQLSSVVVRKNKCHDFIVGPGFWGVTCAVQDFEDYSRRDYGRPASDSLSGMLPPKLAKMMLNLSGAKLHDNILDPFCGSGTVLTEALAMGFDRLTGCDNSVKAVEDAQENVDWLINSLSRNIRVDIFNYDVRHIAEKIQSESIDAIVTEPYLGPPLRGREKSSQIEKIVADLESLYHRAFVQFNKILAGDGALVIVIPQWHIDDQIFDMNINQILKSTDLELVEPDSLIYQRPKQKVWRRIMVFKK